MKSSYWVSMSLAAVCWCMLILRAAESLSAVDVRVISILENERMLEAEPNISLLQFFENKDPDIRVRAVLAAARIGNPAIVPALARMVTDREATVRRHVAFSLGQIGSKEGLAPVLRLMRDPDRDVRRLSLEASGRIGGLEVTSSILPFLEDPDISLREQAALALALVKDRGAVKALVAKAAKDDPAQWSYVYALYRIADKRAVPVLHQVLLNPSKSPSTGDPSSLLFALKALGSMKTPLTHGEIERLLEHPDSRVQSNALDVISASPDSSACPLIAQRIPAMHAVVKRKALESAGAAGCTDILWAFLQNSNPGLKGMALESIARSMREESLSFLEAGVQDPSWVVRWSVAQGLSHLKEESAAPLLRRLVEDSDSSVRLAALESLSQFLPENSDVFIPLLESDDFAVRATAADSLGKTKDPKYLPALIDVYRASSSSEMEARIAILDTLAEFQTSEVLDLYIEALADPEYVIRRHAVDAIRKTIGPKLYFQGEVKDVDEFLFLQRKVPAEKLAQYPVDYGTAGKAPVVVMVLEKGAVEIRLLANESPMPAENFARLVEKEFYNGLRIHRVVPNFVVQGGDPRGDGWGTGPQVLKDQFGFRPFTRGVVGMPTAGKDSGGCQFFITHSRQPHLDGNYTIFGEVISGMEFVDSTEIGDRILKVSVKSSPE